MERVEASALMKRGKKQRKGCKTKRKRGLVVDVGHRGCLVKSSYAFVVKNPTPLDPSFPFIIRI